MMARAHPTRADLQQLVALLQQQHQEALGGNFTALPALGDRIATLCDRIEGCTAPPGPRELALLTEVRRLAERGQRDARALISGLNTAARQLQTARESASHGIYGPAGERVRIAAPEALLERRR